MTEVLKPSECSVRVGAPSMTRTRCPLPKLCRGERSGPSARLRGSLTKVHPPDGLAYERTLEDAGSVLWLRLVYEMAATDLSRSTSASPSIGLRKNPIAPRSK
jgi:hypothetical protein